MRQQQHVAHVSAWTDWTLQPAWTSRGLQFASRCLLLFCGLLVCSGCANFYEKRAITAFQAGLEEGNIAALKEKATPRFNSQALRHPNADDSLAQLKIPDGKFEILDVENVSKTEKKVTVGFGEDFKRKVLYRLVKDEKAKSWMVDDIYLRQRSGEKAMAMAVTEQMDVLLSSREIFEAWNSGERDQVLAKSSREFSAELEQLPPAVLANFVNKTMGSSDRTRTFRPEALISGDEAIVKLNRAHGTIVMTMNKVDSGWELKDLALETRAKDKGGEITSLTATVHITNQAMKFLNAWQENDKEKLKTLTQDRFYQAGLAPSNLQEMPLPSAYAIAGKVDVNIMETYADVIVQEEGRTIRLILNDNKETENVYEVADVTLYNLKTNQTLSLSSAMTARPVADLFVESLRLRDQKMLQYSSTMDLHKKTWSRVSQETLNLLPMPYASLEGLKPLETKFDGPITHVVLQAADQQKLTVVLHDQNGKVLVDDLLISSAAEQEGKEPKSLKHYLSAVAPVYEMAASIHHNQPQATLRLVTDDFYDRVFSLSTTMPQSAYSFLDHVSAGQPKLSKAPNGSSSGQQPTTMQANLIQPNQPVIERYLPQGGETLVEFTTPTGTMQISLREEQGLLRIDDAVVMSADNQVVTRLKQSMRMDLASARTQNMIRTVSGETRTIPAGVTAAVKRAPSNPQNPGEQTVADPLPETTLQNAHYEEYQNALNRPIQQTMGHETPTVKPPVDISQIDRTPQRPQEPQRHNASLPAQHLLLKPIPLE